MAALCGVSLTGSSCASSPSAESDVGPALRKPNDSFKKM